MTERAVSEPDGIGASVLRREDLRLVRGEGRYTGDESLPDTAHAVFVRSPYAHAQILSVDAGAATTLPGVLAVLTGEDAADDGLQPIPHNPDWRGPPDAELRLPEGFEVFVSDHPPLAHERVRFVGEPVAMVIADTLALAQDASELVEVNYRELPAVVDARDAQGDDAPQLFAGSSNLALTCEVGDRSACDAAFASAAHVVSLTTWVHRVTGSPMEPRAALAKHDAARDHYTLWAASGRGAVQTRERLAQTLGVSKDSCRVVSGDMGGNFGTRNGFAPEYTLVAWASRRTGRPVRWVASRSECFLTDYQARDLWSRAELALDEDGRFLALRGENTLNLGAYCVYFWPLRKGLSMMQAVYRMPAVHFHGHAVLTNTAPTAVYRSAGRPEAIFVIERLIDMAAQRFGFDRIELRRKNLITPGEMPFLNAVGVTYDSGEYENAMQFALDEAAWQGFEARAEDARRRGLRRGIALANYIEVTSGIPRERVELHVRASGTVEMVVGTMSSGQSHETTFPQLVSDWLHLPLDRVVFVANDTDRVSVGGGSHSGRSMRLVSIAAREAADDLLRQARDAAALALQASASSLRYENGAFVAPGGSSVNLFELAAASAESPSNSAAADQAGQPAGGLSATGDITNRRGGYPYGAHVCEVEVDPETGELAVVQWVGVDDVGRAVNPMVLHGQAQGAIAQGLGQAVSEAVRYESSSGQLLTGSFMDYAMPRADWMPPLRTRLTEVPASSHPHGIRPGGEGGTTPALAVVVNAVVHALREFGVEHIEMPLTSERILRAIRGERH